MLLTWLLELQGLKFLTFPYLLTMQLKRFDFDYTTMHRIKLNDRSVSQSVSQSSSFLPLGFVLFSRNNNKMKCFFFQK